MIERLEDLPEGVDGFSLVGEITKADYKSVLIPWLEQKIERGDGIRCVLVLDDRFEGYEGGAVWEDTKLGGKMEFVHRGDWKRIALVTDAGWVKRLASVFGWLTPGEMKLFASGEDAAAASWAAG